MRGILTLIQRSFSHVDDHQLRLRLHQHCNMGRAATTPRTDPEFRTQTFSASGAAVQRSRPKRKAATSHKSSETLARSQPAAAAAHEQSPSRPTKKVPSDYWESAGQGAVTASVDDPRTPDQPSEKRIRRRNVRLARTETVTASIPQQVAAVASLPTQSGAHTFEEAPVAVWSKELMQEAMTKLSAADPCE